MAGITGKANTKQITLAEQALLEIIKARLTLANLDGIYIRDYPTLGSSGQALDIVFWETSNHSMNPPRSCYVLAFYGAGKTHKMVFGHRDANGVYSQLWAI